MLCFLAMGGSVGCLRDAPDLPPVLEGAAITGQVFHRDGTTGEIEPLAEARIGVRGTSASATTDALGRFQVSRLPLGSYDVDIRDGELGLRVGDVRLEVDGVALDLGELRLGRPGGLEGTIELRPTSGPSFRSPGVLTQLVGTSFRGFTSAEGRWQVPVVPAGTYGVAMFLAGFRPQQREDVPVLPQLQLEMSSVLLDERTESSARAVAGLVIDADGAPVEGAAIEVFDFAGKVTDAVSRAEGRFELNLASGAYRFEYRAEGRVPVALDGVVVLPEQVLGLVPVVLDVVLASDTDRDGVPDDIDEDDDGDGVPDDVDLNPNDPLRGADRDGNGVADVVDPNLDVDGDGLDEQEELLPGEDGWQTDPFDADTDGDGVLDGTDVCPTVADPDQTDSDGDGRGDACSGGTAPQQGPVPSVQSFSPTEAGLGDVLTIRGSNFPSAAALVSVRFGDDGALTRPDAASATTLSVRVPEGARTGTVTVFTPARALPLATPFCFNPDPSVDAIDTGAAPRAASMVTVTGSGLVAPTCAVDPSTAELVVTSTQGGVRSVAPAAPVDEVVVDGRLRQRLSFVLPPDVGSGPMRVSRGGRSSAPIDVAVESSALRVTALEPPTLTPGNYQVFRGEAFLVAGGPLILDLPGHGPLTVVARSDEVFGVNLPNDVTNGTATLSAFGGIIQTRFPVALRTDTPRVDQVEPRIAFGFTDLLVRGVDLGGVTAVLRPDGREVNPTVLDGGNTLRITVSGTTAGPLVLRHPSGDLVTERIAAITRANLLTFSRQWTCTVDTGADLLAFTQTQYERLDRDTLAVRAGPALTPFGALNPSYVRITPDGARMVAADGLRTQVFTTNPLAAVGPPCVAASTRSSVFGGDLTADGTTAYVRFSVNRNVVQRVDMVSGTCEDITVPTSLGTTYAHGPDDADSFFVGTSLGVYRLDRNPNGAWVETQLSTRGVSAFSHFEMHWDPFREQLLFQLGGPIGYLGLDLSGASPREFLFSSRSLRSGLVLRDFIIHRNGVTDLRSATSADLGGTIQASTRCGVSVRVLPSGALRAMVLEGRFDIILEP